MGDAPLNERQDNKLLNLFYANQEVFSLSEEDFGFYDHLYQSIPTIMDKPIYLPHRAIPQQLQHEVHDGLDRCLKQGIMKPSSSTYTLQVVIDRKKTGNSDSVSTMES